MTALAMIIGMVPMAVERFYRPCHLHPRPDRDDRVSATSITEFFHLPLSALAANRWRHPAANAVRALHQRDPA